MSWNDIPTIIGSGAILALIVGYFLNRRLEAHKTKAAKELEAHKATYNKELEAHKATYNKDLEIHRTNLKINEAYVQAALNGMNQFLGNFKDLVDVSRKLEQNLKNDKASKETIKEFEQKQKIFLESFKNNRIYLSKLIPFGKSINHAIFSNLQTISKAVTTNRRVIKKNKADVLKAIEWLQSNYLDMARLIDEARQSILIA